MMTNDGGLPLDGSKIKTCFDGLNIDFEKMSLASLYSVLNEVNAGRRMSPRLLEKKLMQSKKGEGYRGDIRVTDYVKTESSFLFRFSVCLCLLACWMYVSTNKMEDMGLGEVFNKTNGL